MLRSYPYLLPCPLLPLPHRSAALPAAGAAHRRLPVRGCEPRWQQVRRQASLMPARMQQLLRRRRLLVRKKAAATPSTGALRCWLLPLLYPMPLLALPPSLPAARSRCGTSTAAAQWWPPSTRRWVVSSLICRSALLQICSHSRAPTPERIVHWVALFFHLTDHGQGASWSVPRLGFAFHDPNPPEVTAHVAATDVPWDLLPCGGSGSVASGGGSSGGPSKFAVYVDSTQVGAGTCWLFAMHVPGKQGSCLAGAAAVRQAQQQLAGSRVPTAPLPEPLP